MGSSRFPRPLVCRGDRRGLVHYTPLENASFDEGRRPATPAACGRYNDAGLAMMCDGPLEDFPTCLWCIAMDWRT